ncbi:MAG TPA: hypothetical protein VLT36_04635 [Candidatus Dormibacteraeota bacterium]|nr:hypothetical protein [Candidatus Dormibacteraeota bacterium]
MNRQTIKALGYCAALGLLLLAGGCSTAEMKGTPFYSGEYGKRKGPAEQRVNGWPLVYYREPALSVLWPIFEFTDDHSAVRPIFSVYGLDRGNREYNVLWPLAQFDRETRDNRIFPFFWGDDYHVLFPLYWHYDQPFGPNGGTDSLFPLWLLSRERTNDFSLFAPWPLVHTWSEAAGHESGSMVLPFYWHKRDDQGSLFVSLPWMSGSDVGDGNWRALPPFFFQMSNALHCAVVTPLWAAGHSQTTDWKAIIPFAYWDREEHTLLSPLWGHWQWGDSDLYLAPWLLSWANHSTNRTELWLAAGVAHASWGEKGGSHYAFPFYYRNAHEQTLLTPLIGWNGNEGYYYPFTPLFGVRTGEQSGSWLFPLYSHSNARGGRDVSDRFVLLGGRRKSPENYHSWFVPIYSYSHSQSSDRGRTVKASVLGFLYDYKHELGPGSSKKPAVTNDYTRARICWRLWHYERLNGNVSVDVFPSFTYDSKTNGFTKTSFLWRLFRYESSPGATPALDVLFVPVSRPQVKASNTEAMQSSIPDGWHRRLPPT